MPRHALHAGGDVAEAAQLFDRARGHAAVGERQQQLVEVAVGHVLEDDQPRRLQHRHAHQRHHVLRRGVGPLAARTGPATYTSNLT